MVKVLSEAPASGTLPYGKVVYVDDGSTPPGVVEKLTGGSNSRGISRQVEDVIDPRILPKSDVSPKAVGGSAVQTFLLDFYNHTSNDHPVHSLQEFIQGNPEEFRAAANGISHVPKIAQLAAGDASDLGQDAASLLGGSIGGAGGALAAVFPATAAAGVDPALEAVTGVTLAAGGLALDIDKATGGGHLFNYLKGHVSEVYGNVVNRVEG